MNRVLDAPPVDVLGGLVSFQGTPAVSKLAFVQVESILAFPEGLLLVLNVGARRKAPDDQVADNQWTSLLEVASSSGFLTDSISDNPSVRVVLPGRSRVTSMTQRAHWQHSRSERVESGEPVVLDIDWSTSSTDERVEIRRRLWVSPLPEADCTFEVVWPQVGLAADWTLNEQEMRKAANAAVQLW